jgi:hypothetical protein
MDKQGDETLTIERILEAFATAGRVVPRSAISQATERWDEAAPVLLEMIEDAAATPADELPERSRNILFYTIYLMAQQRETRAFRPLCRLAAQPQALDAAIGDGITEDFSAILARVFEGDIAPLHTLIEDTGADEFVRAAAFETMSWLAAIGAIDREEASGFLREMFTSLQPQGQSYAWVGWQNAVAALGLKDLAPLVEQVFERGWIEDMFTEVSEFRADLRLSLRPDTSPTEIFGRRFSEDHHYDDVASWLATWEYFNPKPPRTRGLDHSRQWHPSEPVRNPLRDVGRNDPCPCGSGQKFKKCCLGKAA